jgi:hypothetical protein
MGRFLRFLTWAARLPRCVGKPRTGTPANARHRRLLFEPLEPKALLSASPIDLTSTRYGSATPQGLTPNQIRGAYGLGSYTSGVLSGGVSFAGIQGDGRGQTIAVVDAYDYPTALADLNAFSAYYGLPQFNGSGEPTFEKLNQTGGTSLPGTDPSGPSDDDWEGEEALDIEWAHAIAPMANIILFEATNDNGNGSDLFTAAQTAADTPGVVVVSMSWTFDESSFTSSQVANYDSTVFTTPAGHVGGSATLGGTGIAGGVTFLSAAGDNGPYEGDGTTLISPQYPATSPNVVAVGGTTLTVDGTSPNYTYGGETAWGEGERTARESGGGGGISALESQPSYQNGVVNAFSTTKRTYPDVSADANPSTGVAIYDTYDDGTETPWDNDNGGTSLSTPIWGGIIAIADEGRAIAGQGSLNSRTQTLPLLYSLPSADFHDITTGSTGASPTYDAGPGYDLATGIGSPVANLLIPGLVDYQPTVTVVSPATGSAAGGTSVTITGTDFTGATLVDFGSSPATNVVVKSATQITATSPSGSGMVNVTVTGPGGVSATSAADEFTYASAPATITAVSTTDAAGVYRAGAAIPITITFSAAVTVTGTPELALNAGGATANFTSGSGTTTLTFSYTVAAGQSTSDLDYTSTAALSLNGGTIGNSSGGAATLTLPATGTDGLAAADLVVAATAPMVTAVASTASGVYGAGTSIPITVTFSEPVTVTGTPQLALNAGSGAAANYTSGSGTATLTFTYAVASGQSTSGLDYTSTSALSLNGGTITDAYGDVAILTLPATGTDGLAARDIAVALISDGFESGNFSALPWQLSTVGNALNWFVESNDVHDGTYAAQSGEIGPGASNSTLSVTLTVAAGELSFWRSTSSATGSGSLIFEIDGVPQLQLSGSTPWQQSFFWVSAGTHTFSWLYAMNAADPAGNDYAYLDDVQFLPGTTLTVEGSTGSSVYSFNASGSTIVVALNGEIHSFAPGDFTNFVFTGGGGGTNIASLTGSASGNSVSLYTSGVGQLVNSTAGYTVNVSGVASIVAVGHAGDTAHFYDSAGNDTFYAYADYAGSGQLAGMYGAGYSNSAAGFGTNVGTNLGTAAAGATDMAGFFDSPGNDTYYAYTDYNSSGQQYAGMSGSYGGGYSNSAKGFGTNVGFSSNGGSDTADFYDSLGNTTFYSYADYLGSGQQLAGMLTSASGYAYSDSARGFPTNVATSTAGATDTAEFFDSPGASSFYAYANYNNTGQTLAGMYGSYGGGYTNSATGFATMVGNSVNGSGDVASLYGGTTNDTLYTDAAIASLYGNNGAYTEQALGFAIVNANGGTGVNTEGQGPVSYQLNYIGNWT